MTQGPAQGLTVRSAPDPREDEAAPRGPLPTAPAPGVAHRHGRFHGRFLGGAGDRVADRESVGRAPRRRRAAGRIVQANRGFLDHAAMPPARDTGPRRFPDLGGGFPAPVNLGAPVHLGGVPVHLGGVPVHLGGVPADVTE